MVQILPPKTNLGTQLGQALGSGLSSGLQRGSEIGFQRGMLQNALSGLENLPKDTTPFQLASKLMQATAGIPGAERYVGQLYPLLLGQLKNQAAFGGEGGPEGQSPFMPSQQQQGGYSTSQVTKESTPEAGGILGNILSQDEIDRLSQNYAQRTGSGLEGYQQAQQHFLNRNQVALQQRALAEQKAADLGIKPEEMPLFQRIGQRHKNLKNFDEWVTKTNRDFQDYKNLTKTLDQVNFPSFGAKILGQREPRLKKLENTVSRLVELGFEPETRQKLAEEGLSPTEINEVIHPPTDQQLKNLDALPINKGRTQARSPEQFVEQQNKITNFLKENITPETSLLGLRQRLWQEKDYNWEDLAQAFKEATQGKELTPSQLNEMTTIETQPPRQSLNYIFHGIGNFLQTFKGQK